MVFAASPRLVLEVSETNQTGVGFTRANQYASFSELKGLRTAESLLIVKAILSYFTGMCSGSEAGSYLRLVDFCIAEFWA